MSVLSQIMVNILADTLVLGLLAVGMGLRVRSAQFYDFSYFSMFALGAYLIWFFTSIVGLNITLAIFTTIIILGVIAYAVDILLLRKPLLDGHRLETMVASLGIFVVIENLLSLLAGPDNKLILNNSAVVYTLSWLPSEPVLNSHQVTGSAISLFIIIFLVTYILKSTWGIRFRATDDNRNLALAMGLRPWRIVSEMQVVCVILAGLSGILYGLDRDLVPEMALRPMLHVTIAIVLGGLGTLMGPFWGLLVVTSIWHFSGLFFDTKWQDVSVFIMLLGVLISMPKGLSGNLTGALRQI